MDAAEIKKKLEERAKRLRERELTDITKVLKLPEGRRLLWRIIAATEIFKISNRGDYLTDIREGRKEIGLMIYNDLNKADPEAFLQMQREYKSEQVKFKSEIPEEEDSPLP